jgi:hypothetical protein
MLAHTCTPCLLCVLCAPQLEAMRRGIEREFEALEAELLRLKGGRAAAAAGCAGCVQHSKRGGGAGGGAGAEARKRRRVARASALAKLRPPPAQQPSAATLLAAGAACGAAAVLLAVVGWLAHTAHGRPAAAPHVAALVPVLRGPLLVMQHVVLCVRARACVSAARAQPPHCSITS